MKLLFFLGASLVLIGMGIVVMGHRAAGVVILCIGVACIAISFMSMKMIIAVQSKIKKK